MMDRLDHDNAAQREIARLKLEVESLQQQLMQAQKLSSIGALSASITHEFNNILTTVINYAKLGMRQKDPTSREKAFDKILAAGQRASKITTGMLSFARHGGDRQESTDLSALVSSVLVLVEKDLMMHRVRCETNIEGQPYALLNPTQIQQVLLNLIVNARQAMKNGGQLTISVKANPETGFAEVAVRDSGSGIPADKLRHIFDRFYTTKTADEHGQGGTGLGLALAREVIESHKGRIRVESTIGKGTTFTLKLPLASPPALLMTKTTPLQATPTTITHPPLTKTAQKVG
ncbi:MAG: sensor histidine kinase [Planctomycetaceae bacterium]